MVFHNLSTIVARILSQNMNVSSISTTQNTLLPLVRFSFFGKVWGCIHVEIVGKDKMEIFHIEFSDVLSNMRAVLTKGADWES